MAACTRFALIALVTGLATALPLPACATAEERLHLSLATASLAYDMQERSRGGGDFSRDTGTLHSQALSLHWGLGERGEGRKPWQLQLNAQQDSGNLGYRGLSSAALPLLSSSRLRQQRLGLGLWWRLSLPEPWRARLGLQWAMQQQQRDIAATPLSAALHERLRQQEAGLGLHLARRLGDSGWQLQAQWQQAWPFQQRLHADGGDALDPVQLRPQGGRSQGRALGLGWHGRLGGQGLHAALWHQVQRQDVGDSAAMPATRQGLPLGTVRFPGHTRRSHGWWLELGLRWP